MVFGFDSATTSPRRKCTRSRGGAIVMAAPARLVGHQNLTAQPSTDRQTRSQLIHVSEVLLRSMRRVIHSQPHCWITKNHEIPRVVAGHPEVAKGSHRNISAMHEVCLQLAKLG
jgi:hypothetical protein